MEPSLEILKVKSDVINPTFTQNKTLSIVSRKPFNTEQGRLAYFEPLVKEYYPVRSTHINNISVWLTDRKDRPIGLRYGQPTIVVLKFQKMPVKNRSFIVRVQSSDDPSGTSSDFQANLPPGLSANPEQKWSVSLNSILYKGKFVQNIYNANPVLYLKSWQETDSVEEEQASDEPDTEEVLIENDLNASRTEEQKVEKKTEEVEEVEKERVTFVSEIPLTHSHFNRNSELFRHFKQSLAKHKATLPNGSSAKVFRRVRLTPASGKIIVGTILETELNISWSWAVMLGIKKSPDAYGLVVLKFKPYQEYEFDMPMNYNVWTPNSIFLYANFIDYSPIGHVEAPILKIIPILEEGGTNTYHLFESQTEERHSVVFSQLSNLRFQLRRVDGERVEFEKQFPSDVILSLKEHVFLGHVTNIVQFSCAGERGTVLSA